MTIAAIVLLMLLHQQGIPNQLVAPVPGQPDLAVTCDRLTPNLVIYTGSDNAVGFGRDCVAAFADWQDTTPNAPPVFRFI